jgi:uncharacterized circularly permuted ATP-grasp superfamily protein
MAPPRAAVNVGQRGSARQRPGKRRSVKVSKSDPRDILRRAMKWVVEKERFDEIFERTGAPRSHYRALIALLRSFTPAEIERRERLQKLSLMNQGITFTVYGEKDGIERIFPFDFVPRIIPAAEWQRVQTGLIQRISAINLFLLDLYQDQKCLKDGLVPPDLVFSRKE